jgi:PAS domain S-box-containing protein
MVESSTELGDNLLWRTYIEEASDLIFTLDAAGRIASVNRAVCETTGYSARELLGKNPLEFIPPESHPLVETRLRKLLSGESVDRVEVEVLSKDGRRITLEVRGRALYDKGRMLGTLQIARDITERRRAEEASSRLAAIVESSDDAIISKTLDGVITSWNQGAEKLYGYSAEEAVGKPIFILLPPNRPDELTQILERVKRGERVQHYEIERMRKDGKTIDVSLTVSAIRDPNGRIVGASSIARDITEHRLMEEELRELSRAVEQSPSMVMITNTRGEIEYVNRKFTELSGYSAQEIMGMTAGKLGEQPDEAEKQLWEILRSSKEWRGEFCNRKKNGELYWESASISPILNSEGVITHYVKVAEDTTERKRMEEEIRNLARFPSENPNPILRLGRDGTVLSTNEASKELLQHWSSGIGRAAPKSWCDMAADALSSGRSRNIDIELGDKSYTFLVKPNMEDGYVNLYGRDITERKRAEDALRRRAEELAALQATVLDITGSHDLPTLLQTIVERAARLLRATAGEMYLCDPEKHEARCVVSYNTPHDYTGTLLKYGEGAAGIVAQTGEPLTVDDYRSWQGRTTVFEEEQPFTAVLTVPMIWKGKVTGVIDVLDDTPSRGFTQADQELLTLLANHAAIAVENTRLLDDEKRHAEELTRYSTNLEQLVLERTGKLAESERRFRELSDLLPQIVFEIDENGGIQFMNRAAFAETGCTEEEFRRGVNAFQMLAPADHDRAKQGIQRMMAGETIGGREFTVLRRDGTTFPVIVYTAPVMREGKAVGLRGIAIDITERKRAEEELRAARERLEYMITSNPAVIFTARPRPDFSDFDTTYMSRSVVSLLGFRPQDLIGGTEMWQTRVHPDDLHRYYADLPLLWKEGEHTFEYRFLHKDGNYLWIREEAKVIRDAAGKPTEVMGYWTDITDEKQMDEMRDRFISAVTHELRTPLISISGYLDLVLTGDSGPFSSEVKANLEVVKRNTDRLTSLTDDLLDIQRLQSGKLQVNLQPIDLREIIEHATSEIRPFIRAKKQRFNVAVPKKPLPILGDPVRLSQVLMNLLSNASKFTPEGGTIRLTISDDRLIIVVKVADTGIGLRREDLTRVFEPFAAIKKPTHIKGTGLGLSVTKGLVEAHMGRIWAESSGEGKGATFTFALPKREVK